MPWKLKRLRQCDKCPWKVSTNPHDIPHGYSEEQHRNLTSTIAAPGVINDKANAMSCHEHDPGEEAHCVGWLMNQLGPGNNIPLRLRVMDCENIQHVQLDGTQHEKLEDTFPSEELTDD
jgi:hypothetical protein